MPDIGKHAIDVEHGHGRTVRSASAAPSIRHDCRAEAGDRHARGDPADVHRRSAPATLGRLREPVARKAITERLLI